MSRFSPNQPEPEHLSASITALAEQTNRLAVEAAMEAARADARGQIDVVVEQVCRLAVSAGVATGEIAWLVGELQLVAGPRSDAAYIAVAGMEACMRAVADAVEVLAARGMPTEVGAAAEALRRVSGQLSALLPRVQRA